MFRWVARTYARRIVNININIILAGLLALPVVLGILKIAESFGLTEEHPTLVSVITFVADIVADVAIYFVLHWLANHSPWRKKVLEDVAAAADHLHLFTENDGEPGLLPSRGAAETGASGGAAGAGSEQHAAGVKPAQGAGAMPKKLVSRSAEALRFLKDAAVVQVERAALSPLLYVLWLGIQQYLLRDNHSLVFSTVAGFCIAIAIVRTIHTLWMIRRDRRAALAVGQTKPAQVAPRANPLTPITPPGPLVGEAGPR